MWSFQIIEKHFSLLILEGYFNKVELAKINTNKRDTEIIIF